jgi:hypothetical protein
LFVLGLLILAVWLIRQQRLRTAYSLWEYVEAYSDDESRKDLVEEKIQQLIVLNEVELVPLMTEATIKNSGFDLQSKLPLTATRILAGYQHPQATKALLSLMNPPPQDGPIPGYAFVAASAIASRGPSAIPTLVDFLEKEGVKSPSVSFVQSGPVSLNQMQFCTAQSTAGILWGGGIACDNSFFGLAGGEHATWDAGRLWRIFESA